MGLGNEAFAVCENMISLPPPDGLGWSCQTDIPGFGQEGTESFKRCLDGLVLAPFVTLSFLHQDSEGCPEPCTSDLQAAGDFCGPVNCIATLEEESGSQITVGNLSMPGGAAIPIVDPETGEWGDPEGNFWATDTTDKCSSAIKSFQYSFDNTGGATCKIKIMDEAGSSFEYWINKLVRNIECARRFYKMRIEFGWIGVNPTDPDAPGCDPDFLTETDSPCGINCIPPEECGDSPCDIGTRPCQARVIARSGPLYFVPRDITASLQNGRVFEYEIIGVDLMRVANEQKYSGSFPDENQTDTVWRFKKAVLELLKTATPSIDFAMYSVPFCGGEPEELRFWVPPGQAHPIDIRERENIPCRDGPPSGAGDTRPPCSYKTITEQMYDPIDGPIDEWKGNNMPLYEVLKLWTKRVRADDGTCEGKKRGKGIVVNWDSRCPTPRLLIWADPFATCSDIEGIDEGRCIGTYIVGGGKCSPVISFNPNMKWVFNAAMRSGGTMSPGSGTATSAQNVQGTGGQAPTACQVSGGRGIRQETTVHNGDHMRNGPGQAGTIAMQNSIVNERTQAIQGMLPIEADLTVQGDPTIGSVMESIGKTVGVVVINPFFVRNDDNPDQSMTSQPTMPNIRWPSLDGCPYWSTVTGSVVNEVLTNRNWFIRGIDHQIKEGEFTTTYKIYLPAPGSDIGANAGLGGNGRTLQPQGVFAPPGITPDGDDCSAALSDEDSGWRCCVEGDPQYAELCAVPGIPPCPTPPCPPEVCP